MSMDCLLKSDEIIARKFRPFALKMEEIGQPALAVNFFRCAFSQLLLGDQGKVPENHIVPVEDDDVVPMHSLTGHSSLGRRVMKQTVIIKLNGGLGTTMGLQGAKSLIKVKDDLSFLDLIVRQVLQLRKKYDAQLPLLFMNSFRTHRESMVCLEDFDNGATGLPPAFVQHRFPKILAKDYTPASWPHNPELEWNPPGHGDIYAALVTSGLLDRLLDDGICYAFVSNADNLGAVMDERILGHMVHARSPFVMEVARRTPSDRKGGHLAKDKKSGRLMLRELAQCPDHELHFFGDIEKHRYFNTNSLWIDLRAVRTIFGKQLRIPLDLLVNTKTVDPRDAHSPQVFQLETAMGSAISAFENARAVLVPRTRFAPVKTTNDLLVIQSDCYVRTVSETIEPVPDRAESLPFVDLDPKYFKNIVEMEKRFPAGPPSMKECGRFVVKGDVLFEGNVRLQGDVVIENGSGVQQVVVAGTTLSDAVRLG